MKRSNKHHYLWLGSYLNEKVNQMMISQGYRNPASYVSQKNLLEGIEQALGITFDSVGAVSVMGYPRQGNIVLKGYRYSHSKGSYDVCAGYFNPLYANKFFMREEMLNELKKWINKRYTDGDELDVFVYELRSACLDSVAFLKKRIPNSKIHLLIPDLPCFMDLNMSKFKKILKDIDWNRIVRELKYIDDFIPYASTMVDYLGIRNKKYIVMEGSISGEDINHITFEIEKAKKTIEKCNKCIIMYSGWIDSQYGIDNLVKSMDYVNENTELWITGGGTYSDQLKEKVRNNKKVKYYGFLPSRADLFKLQAQADVLMNMRDPSVESAHYCFPSKIFEYMLLGRPVISVKLRGIPDEYFQYMYGLDSINPKEIAHKINEVMADPNRFERAQNGQEFIKKEKSNIAQARKIIEFTGLKGTSERNS